MGRLERTASVLASMRSVISPAEGNLVPSGDQLAPYTVSNVHRDGDLELLLRHIPDLTSPKRQASRRHGERLAVRKKGE